jgi:hypothetical protein
MCLRLNGRLILLLSDRAFAQSHADGCGYTVSLRICGDLLLVPCGRVYDRLKMQAYLERLANLDFARVLKTISGFFQQEGFSFALIGAFGLHAYGLSRATQDLDFVVEAAAQDKLIAFLEFLRYRTLHRSSGYSSHCHANAALGRLDFVYISGDTSRKIFQEAKGSLEIGGVVALVPRPEHLAAMKIHAIKTDPSRTLQDLSDIQFLLGLPGVDEDEVRVYFEKSGLLRLYEEIKKKS